MTTFTHEGVTLILGDCLEHMARMADGAYSLAVVDPPYGIGDFTNPTFSRDRKVTVSRFSGTVTWNDNIPPPEYFYQLTRVSQERIIWGANYYNSFDGKGGAIIWDKEQPHPNMSRCEIASYSRTAQVKYVNIKWASLNRTEETFHPCQKPVALYRWLLQNYARPGDTILDTHLGSGSSAIAAWEMGYTFTGIEIDEDYYHAAVERFKRRIAQPYLPGLVKPAKPEQVKLI